MLCHFLLAQKGAVLFTGAAKKTKQCKHEHSVFKLMILVEPGRPVSLTDGTHVGWWSPNKKGKMSSAVTQVYKKPWFIFLSLRELCQFSTTTTKENQKWFLSQCFCWNDNDGVAWLHAVYASCTVQFVWDPEFRLADEKENQPLCFVVIFYFQAATASISTGN